MTELRTFLHIRSSDYLKILASYDGAYSNDPANPVEVSAAIVLLQRFQSNLERFSHMILLAILAKFAANLETYIAMT